MPAKDGNVFLLVEVPTAFSKIRKGDVFRKENEGDYCLATTDAAPTDTPEEDEQVWGCQIKPVAVIPHEPVHFTIKVTDVL